MTQWHCHHHQPGAPGSQPGPRTTAASLLKEESELIFLKHFDERRKVRNILRLFLEKVSGLKENFGGGEQERE